MRYAEALAWLYGVQPLGIKLGLEGTRHLLDALDVDVSPLTVWHVAGTNGKGSVCAFLESVLRRSSRRTGLFTSPHLVSFRERIRINFEPAEESVIAENLTRMRGMVRDWETHPTFFELTTVLALRVFLDAGVEELILETGMGGRLDSTNAIPSDVSVITSIGLDHRKWLGDTVGLIAAEKAGIFKPGIPAIVPAALPEEAATVMRERARTVGSPLHVVEAPSGPEWPLGLRGSHQRWNAALAVAALRTLRPDLEESVIRDGLAGTRWPARFDVFQRDGRTIVVDGAHNPDAALVLARTWREEFGDEPACLIFGAVEDKDSAAMLAELRGIADQVIFTTAPTQRGRSASGLAEELGLRPGDLVIGDPAEALARARSGKVLVAGSLFLAGKVLELLGAAEVYEPSLQ